MRFHWEYGVKTNLDECKHKLVEALEIAKNREQTYPYRLGWMQGCIRHALLNLDRVTSSDALSAIVNYMNERADQDDMEAAALLDELDAEVDARNAIDDAVEKLAEEDDGDGFPREAA